MDIQKKLNRNPRVIQRFAITALAAAICSFHNEAAMAVPCPSQITGSVLAGMVCDFSATASVTVQNGGEVGGINMFNYNSPSLQLTINAGGLVNNATATGISIISSTLANGLTNNGTISTSALGISIANASTVSGIVNSGSIVSESSTGIIISNSNTIQGSILNSGTITSNGSVNNGIVIAQNNNINGDIINTGTINAGPDGNGIIMHLTNNIHGNITNSGLINSGATGIVSLVNEIIDGNLSNSGTITSGANGIRLSNITTLLGSLSNIGLINAGNDGITIQSQSTVSAITNSGIITGGNSGIVISSTSAISGGISNSGTIQGGTNAIYVDSNSTVSQIDIQGGSARIIGAVDAVNTNFNVTSNATFTSEGTFNVSNFNIGANALFNMANPITATNVVNNAGTLAIQNSTQTINSGGGYVQNAGGILKIGVTNSNIYGQLLVDNLVDLSQSGNIFVEISANSSLSSGAVLTDIISGTTLTAPIDGFTVSDNSFIWKFVADVNGSAGVNLTAEIDPLASNACRGSYCQGAANSILEQVAVSNSAFNPYTFLTTASAFQTAASQATPELTNENTQVSQLVTKSVMDIVPMWTTLHSIGDLMVAEPGKIWVKPYGGLMTQNEKNSVEGFNATAFGAVLGKDISLQDDWLLGGAIAVGGDNLTGNSALSNQSINSGTFQAMLYGARQFSHSIYLAGQGLVGYGNNNTERFIPLDGSTATGSYNSEFIDLRAQIGANFYAQQQKFVISPALDASYFYIHQGNYKEAGSPLDLEVAASNTSSLIFGAYAYSAYQLPLLLDEHNLVATGYAGIARNVLNTQPETTATFLAGGSSFATFGVQNDEFIFRGGIGLALSNPHKPLRVNLNYDLQVGNNAYSSVGSITMTYKI
jgi:hypothetical protein